MEADFFNKTISRNLKLIRKSKGLTTEDLAKILKVSQAKISYMENCKGVLSARDIAILSKRLDLPITEFFKGLDAPGEHSEKDRVASFLIHYGAHELSNPLGLMLEVPTFEQVIQLALGYIEDDRLQKALCAALIAQSAKKDLNVDRIFALIGNNLFLVRQIAKIARLCLSVIEVSNREKVIVSNRSKRQLEKLANAAQDFSGSVALTPSPEETSEVTRFVWKSLNAKK